MSNIPWKQKQSMCFRKKRYSDLKFAQGLASRLTAQRGKQLKVYDCPVCGGYHLAKDRK